MSSATPSAVRPDADAKARVDQLARRAARLHRRILDVQVLRGLLPVRLRRAGRRAATPEARERERRFRDASPAYAAALAEPAADTPHVRQMTLDSLAWSVPLQAPDDPERVARALSHQDIPYRVISQTREAAIGGVMLDIGANLGRMSIPRVILGDVTAAYCAEPDPLNYECLLRNVRDNGLTGLVMPDRVAIGSENGTVRLRRGKSTGGYRVVDDEGGGRKAVDVECRTLDAWVEQLGVDLEELMFIKVDAQGSEVHILRGAARVLACRHVTWQIEIDLKLLAARGFAAEDLYAPLRQHFTHFVDLGHQAAGKRLHRMEGIADALAHVTGGSDGRTDILAMTLDLQDPPADPEPKQGQPSAS